MLLCVGRCAVCGACAQRPPRSVPWCTDPPPLLLTCTPPPPAPRAQVWDRRLLDASGRARCSGVFVGHTEGITHLDSKARTWAGVQRGCRHARHHAHASAHPPVPMQGDGRYLISNSKDQSVKLWDLRRARAFFLHACLGRQRRLLLEQLCARPSPFLLAAPSTQPPPPTLTHPPTCVCAEPCAPSAPLAGRLALRPPSSGTTAGWDTLLGGEWSPTPTTARCRRSAATP